MSAARPNQLRRPFALATAGAAAAGLVLAGPAGAAASGDVQVIDRETVQARLDASGAVESARLYEQLTLIGNGTVEVADPTSGEGVRDLDGFNAPDVEDGKASYTVDVDGRTDRRTVADHTGELPVTLKAEYVLDGERVDPEDVVGRSGRLEATYVVRNATAEPTEIAYKNGRGEDVTETVDLVTPYVGSLATVLPASYSGIVADGASVAGDGRGATKASWSLVLFNPLGEPAQQLGWSADVTDAVLPPAELTVVPVTPSNGGVLASGKTSISEGAAGLTALTGGILKVDGKLGELQAGAGKLLEGLAKLSAGAADLNAGLADSAAPGADQLADGLGKASAGGTTLATGLDTLSVGARKLADGNGSAAAGSQKLADGLASAAAGGEKLAAGSTALSDGADKAAAGAAALSDGLLQISGGLDQLAAASALPAARDGAAKLRAGVDQLLAGLGDPATEGTVLNGVARLSGGLTAVGEGVTKVSTGLGAARNGVDQISSGLSSSTTAGGSLDQLVGALASPAPLNGQPTIQYLVDLIQTAGAGNAGVLQAAGGIEQVIAALVSNINGPGGSRERTAAAASGLGRVSEGLGAAITGLGQVSGGITQLQTGTTALNAGLGRVVLGLSSGDPSKPGLAEGLDSLVGGLTAAVGGVTALATGASTAADGSVALADGTGALAAGAEQLETTGAKPLSAGLGQLLTGGQALDAGLDQLATGSGQLADGAGKAAAGSDTLNSGLGQLLTGSLKLADGLDAAADGSGKLADGIDQVQAGVTSVEDGSRRLSGEGTRLLASSAGSAATGNAQKAAMLQAVSDKATDGALPYGAPEGATGSAAYSLQLAGADTTAQDNTTRGAAALAVLALGSLAGVVRRRRVV